VWYDSQVDFDIQINTDEESEPLKGDKIANKHSIDEAINSVRDNESKSEAIDVVADDLTKYFNEYSKDDIIDGLHLLAGNPDEEHYELDKVNGVDYIVISEY
jgi:cobalamin biosynthesis Mg chelatase CobN